MWNGFETNCTESFAFTLKKQIFGDPIYYLQRRMKINDIVLPNPANGHVAIKHGGMGAWNGTIAESGLSRYDFDLCCNYPSHFSLLYSTINWNISWIVPAASAIQCSLFIADTQEFLDGATTVFPRGWHLNRIELVWSMRIGSWKAKLVRLPYYLLEASRERQIFPLHNLRINDEYAEQRVEGRNTVGYNPYAPFLPTNHCAASPLSSIFKLSL